MKTMERDLSRVAREKFQENEGAPLFYGDWVSAVFVHLKVDPKPLQREVPYTLDLHDGKAYVSLVAFTMKRLRPRLGGRLSAAAFSPMAEHSFLNVRTYVKHEGERGIYFLLEWVSNQLAVLLGPKTFGLPYHYAKLDYRHDTDAGIHDRVTCGEHCLRFEAAVLDDRQPAQCAPGSLDEWLVERYIAFTQRGQTPLYFRVWHHPWQQVPLRVQLTEDQLLRQTCRWYCDAEVSVISGNFTSGVRDVWIGWPRRVKALSQKQNIALFEGN